MLPRWDFRELHATTTDATPGRVFAALQELAPTDSLLFRTLMALRSLPARVARRPYFRVASQTPLLHQFLGAGFAVLAEEPDRELVVGAIGQFWKVVAGSIARFEGREGFAAFDAAGFAKAATNLRIEELAERTLVSTETRIVATDASARLAFERYWVVIRLGSGAIRRSWLAALKRRAERPL